MLVEKGEGGEDGEAAANDDVYKIMHGQSYACLRLYVAYSSQPHKLEVLITFFLELGPLEENLQLLLFFFSWMGVPPPAILSRSSDACEDVVSTEEYLNRPRRSFLENGMAVTESLNARRRCCFPT